MILTKEEISFLKENKEIIKAILEKRKDDIVNALIDVEDEKQKIGFQYLARQFKDGIAILENVSKLKRKRKKKSPKNFTGI